MRTINRDVLIHEQESFRIAWNPDLTGHFASISSYTVWNSLTSLSAYCMCFGTGCDRDGVNALLDLGANINARDVSGRTCLHIFMGHLHGDVRVRKDYGVLECLIERGADVNAQDNSGTSVSRVAYTRLYRRCRDIGSYAGDLWDSFLQSCGYNIEEYRRDKCRKAKYTKRYTRTHFEMLWEGKEHLCPYWDDEPWPPNAEGDSSTDDLEHDSDGSFNVPSDSDEGDEGSSLEEETQEKDDSYSDEDGEGSFQGEEIHDMGAYLV